MSRTPAVLARLAERLTSAHHNVDPRTQDIGAPQPQSCVSSQGAHRPDTDHSPLREGRGFDNYLDLNTVAKHLGAVDVLYSTRAVDGYTEWSSRGPVIQVALARSDGRRRTTLAHECGHLILDPLTSADSYSCFPDTLDRSHRSMVDILVDGLESELLALVQKVGLEKACDLLAYELLLPSLDARAMAQRSWSLSQLRETARTRRVSLSYLVCRINDYGGDLCLIQLQRTSAGSWLAPTGVGLPPWFSGRIVCELETHPESHGQASITPVSHRLDDLRAGLGAAYLALFSRNLRACVVVDLERANQTRILVLSTRTAMRAARNTTPAQ